MRYPRGVQNDHKECLLWLIGALAMTGCYASHRSGGSPPPPPPPTSCDAGALDDAGEPEPETVDLLFVIDNSNSMQEEQASVVAEMPDIVQALSSGDVDFDGEEDVTPVGSLHIGVVTTDMGTGGFVVPTCDNRTFGDDGRLRSEGSPSIDGCAAAYPEFLIFEPERGVDASQFAFSAGCLIAAGSTGCGFEQPLDAMLKALTPASSDIRFFRNTSGHGDGANAGFLRRESVLVVLMLTDEDDCSAQDPDLYNPRSLTYGATDLNLRCFAHDDALHPIERYSRGLLQLRRSQPGRLVFATITGVPPTLTGATEEQLLADPALVNRIDPAMPSRLLPSCDVPSRGTAFPPRRILQVGAAIRAGGGRTIHRSICQSDYGAAVRLILAEVGRAVRPRCP